MSRRRKARELALQVLYAVEVSGDPWVDVFREGVERRGTSGEAADYARRIVRYACEHRPELDRMIADRLENWAFERVSVVDRNILRIALAELLDALETPTNVILNEAIEIAHRFSSADAGRFVNGILDRLAREVRPA